MTPPGRRLDLAASAVLAAGGLVTGYAAFGPPGSGSVVHQVGWLVMVVGLLLVAAAQLRRRLHVEKRDAHLPPFQRPPRDPGAGPPGRHARR